MNDDAIKLLREALATGPTPGPWRLRTWDIDGCAHYAIDTNYGPLIGEPFYEADLPTSEADWKFIAACSPDAIRALLDENDRLRAENEALKADARRIDWLADNYGSDLLEGLLVEYGPMRWSDPKPALREAIDTAMTTREQ